MSTASRSSTPRSGGPVASARSRHTSGTPSRTAERPTAQPHEPIFRHLTSQASSELPSQNCREPRLSTAGTALPGQFPRGYAIRSHTPPVASRESSRDGRYPLQGYSLTPAVASRESSRDGRYPLQGYSLAPSVAARESSRDSRSGLGAVLHATPPRKCRTSRNAAGLPPQPSQVQSRSRHSCASQMQPSRSLTPSETLAARLQRPNLVVA